jgi:hypothetical protein
MDTTDDAREPAVEDRLAGEPLDATDFAVLESLRDFFAESDPVPSGLVERIQFEITLDALQAEIATLTQLDLADSGARGATTEDVRTITFTSASLTTMVTVTAEPDGSVRVDGWAAPGAGLRVELLLPDGPRETYADDTGRFVFEGVPRGLSKFAMHVPQGEGFSTVLTPTIEL